MSAFNPRRTKIVATLGPATSEKKVLVELVKAGMDVARLNFSHADHETHAKNLHTVRKINEELNTNIAILQDLQGPKIRIGDLIKPVKIKPGDVVTLRSDLGKQEKEGGDIPIRYETFAQDVSEGESILMDDGKIQAEVVGSNKKNKVQLKIIFGEEIKSRKGVNLPDTPISLSTITEKDFKDIEFAIEHQVEWLALSFVRSADDIRVLKELIRLKNGTSRIIAKIEKPEALENIDEIIKASDGIMVARGDLGVEIPMERVPVWQKKIIRKCNQAAKPVIMATQVMESMIDSPRHTRAEANDVANALVDGADAGMLGSMLAGLEESPGDIILYEGRRYKMYRGMGSAGAMVGHSADRYGSGQSNGANRHKLVPEGIEGQVPYKGKLDDAIFQLMGGLRAGRGYVGAANLKELREKAEFVRITNAGLRESHHW